MLNLFLNSSIRTFVPVTNLSMKTDVKNIGTEFSKESKNLEPGVFFSPLVTSK